MSTANRVQGGLLLFALVLIALALACLNSLFVSEKYPCTVIQGNFEVKCDSARQDGNCTIFWRKGREGKVCPHSLTIPTEE